MGEGYPDRFYGETPETMAAIFPLLLADGRRCMRPRSATGRGSIGRSRAPWSDAHPLEWRGQVRRSTSRCTISPARSSACRSTSSSDCSAEIPPTDFTIGIDEPAIVAERARRAADFPALKIKCGGPDDLETLRAVREVFAGPIRVDANTGWTRDDAERLLPELVELGVELIEQPFPARAYGDLAWLQERSSLPIVADESAVTFEDLDALVGVVAGVNVKLAKCGGIGPAKAMLERARELGFRTFLGCMEETSVGIAASAAVASLADWVDLDGCLLLADDPFDGLELGPDQRWRLTDRPGLGVDARRDA